MKNRIAVLDPHIAPAAQDFPVSGHKDGANLQRPQVPSSSETTHIALDTDIGRQAGRQEEEGTYVGDFY